MKFIHSRGDLRLGLNSNAIEPKSFAMQGFHHLQGGQQGFLRGLAYLYNLVLYQRRAQYAGQCGVEVEGLTSGSFQ